MKIKYYTLKNILAKDARYNIIFGERGKQINGKRILSAMFTRKYVDQFGNLKVSLKFP